eukprot:tig00021348_g20614.t1
MRLRLYNRASRVVRPGLLRRFCSAIFCGNCWRSARLDARLHSVTPWNLMDQGGQLGEIAVHAGGGSPARQQPPPSAQGRQRRGSPRPYTRIPAAREARLRLCCSTARPLREDGIDTGTA